MPLKFYLIAYCNPELLPFGTNKELYLLIYLLQEVFQYDSKKILPTVIQEI